MYAAIIKVVQRAALRRRLSWISYPDPAYVRQDRRRADRHDQPAGLVPHQRREPAEGCSIYARRAPRLAAERLRVSTFALAVTDGVVSGGGGRVSCLDLAAGQQLELTIPITGELASVSADGSNIDNTFGLYVSSDPALEPVRDYSVIGRDFPMPGIPDQVTGRTVWIGDVRLPGTRMVLRPATLDSTLVSVPELDRTGCDSRTHSSLRKKHLVAVSRPTSGRRVKAARAVQAETSWSVAGAAPIQYRMDHEPFLHFGRSDAEDRGGRSTSGGTWWAASRWDSARR